MRSYSFICALLLVFAAACGNDGKRKSSVPIEIECDGASCEEDANHTNVEVDPPANSQTCAPRSCADNNVCTRDLALVDPETCVTTCAFEPLTTCVSGDGCCAVGCTAQNDDDCSGTVCHDSCPPDGDACTIDTARTDADGCVVACEYERVDSCRNADGCCPSGCSSENDSDCGCAPNRCTDLGVQCGVFSDGCAGTLNCGACPSGQACTSDGRCVASTNPSCSPDMPGSCPQSQPYCIQGSCTECVGAADCASSEICDSGACKASPTCASNPSLCPEGYTCVGNVCETRDDIGCDSNDPTSCPAGFFCDPSVGTCTGAGGDAGCGLCNPDCTCPNGLTCDGFMCSGCSAFTGQDCPEGQVCLDLLGLPLCLPLGV